MADDGSCDVLVIDDDFDFGESLRDILDIHGYKTVVVQEASAALDAVVTHAPAIAMVDIHLGGASGVELLPSLQAVRPDLLCIMITAHVDTPTAIQALRRGAYDYIDKSCEPGELTAILVRAFETHQLRKERSEMIEALRSSKDAAEAGSRAKSNFLATVSHELRTPLNAIIGFSQMILAEAHGPLGNVDYLDYINDINTSGEHLLALINDILDLTKAEAGKLELSDDVISPRDAIFPTIRLLAGRAAGEGVTLSTELSNALPLLRADEMKTRQVLLNLLSNSVKFTPSGGHIEVAAYIDPSGGLAIRVRDTGIGIAPEHLDKVLEPFVQIENSFTRRHDGTGLGLPLVKSIMELHGGTLRLESAIGKGTTATVTFPIDRLVMQAA